MDAAMLCTRRVRHRGIAVPGMKHAVCVHVCARGACSFSIELAQCMASPACAHVRGVCLCVSASSIQPACASAHPAEPAARSSLLSSGLPSALRNERPASANPRLEAAVVSLEADAPGDQMVFQGVAPSTVSANLRSETLRGAAGAGHHQSGVAFAVAGSRALRRVSHTTYTGHAA